VATPSSPAKGDSRDQEIEMTAPVMDFTVKDGRLLERAETAGPPQIVITQPGANQKTVVTAAKFTAGFTEKNRLATLHGEPDAKIVSSTIVSSLTNPSEIGSPKVASSKTGSHGSTDRVSTSRMLEVAFLPEGGVRSITQTGALTYADGAEKAWSQRAEYTTADQ